MNWRIRRSRIQGHAVVPGDKSIAHRALMLAALARGVSTIHDLPQAEDVLATAGCLRSLGARIELQNGRTSLQSDGKLAAPPGPIYAANSGTTMRLMAGILAGQTFPSCIEGDASLSRRPMRRIVEPLRLMGAEIDSQDGRPPLQIRGRPLRGIEFELPVASAQVKSCLLLAGLFASGRTTVIETVASRDHTERMFVALGIKLTRDGRTVAVEGGQRPAPFHMSVPADLSSASFLLAAAALTGGELLVRNVGVNPTRAGFLRVLEEMGASIGVENAREEMGEPVADVSITRGIERAVDVGGESIPLLVDELPLVALLGTQTSGMTVVRDAAELRVKETDRIVTVVESLQALGADIEERPNGFAVRGPTPLRAAPVDARGDHRIAMMLAVAGLIAEGETVVAGAEASAVSFPRFEEVLRSLGGNIAGD